MSTFLWNDLVVIGGDITMLAHCMDAIDKNDLFNKHCGESRGSISEHGILSYHYMTFDYLPFAEFIEQVSIQFPVLAFILEYNGKFVQGIYVYKKGGFLNHFEIELKPESD